MTLTGSQRSVTGDDALPGAASELLSVGGERVSKGGREALGDLEEVLRRVVAASDPSRIVLFGSAARGEQGSESDLDLLVIVDRAVHRGRLTGEIYRQLYGVRTPVDVVVVSEEDALRYADSPGLVIGPALAEGEVVYERRRTAAA